MATIDNIPLWKELKTKYLEEMLIEQFLERITELLCHLSERPVYDDKEDQQQLSANVGMLAAYLLSNDQSLVSEVYVAFMNELSLLNPRHSDLIVKTLMQYLCHEKLAKLGFSWKDLDGIGTDLFAYNVCKMAKFETPLSKPHVCFRYGCALLTSRGLTFTSENTKDSLRLTKEGARSLDTGIGINVCTTINQKLKLTQANSIVHMDEFTKDFILSQARIKKHPVVQRKLLSYDEGDEAIVRIIGIDPEIKVETVDPRYNKISGVIRYERSSLIYYPTDTLYKYFKIGDYLRVNIKNPLHGTFNIDNQLVKFFVEYAEECVEFDGDTMTAKLLDEKPAYTEWLTKIGVAVQVEGPCTYRRGDYAAITIDEFCDGKRLGLIKGYISGDAEEYFDEYVVRKDCIRTFTESVDAPEEREPEEETEKLSPVLLRLLLRMLFEYQKSLLKPFERFRYLSITNIIAELVGDDLSASYISFARTYLRAIIQFVNGQNINDIHLNPDKQYLSAKSTLIRLSIIELLKEYGRKDNSEKLARAISDFEVSLPPLARLARLIQTSNSMQDILPESTLNLIRREIIHTLSIETEDDANLEDGKGDYLGVESGTIEFKTSMVYPPDKKMQSAEKNQNINVMKGICAFLNSTSGGTLYLGVNDQGYVVGLANDMRFLKIQTIDSYMRYVQDVAKKYFGVDALPYLNIEPLYDNQVVAVHVRQHPYRLVELEGVAYLRVNAESRIMPEKMRQELIDQKLFTNKDLAAAISALQHACTLKRCVILHQYASNNGGTVSDRHVEAYDVRPEDNLVICYDLDREATRVFNLNRIGYVEILKDEHWRRASSHKQMYVDVFHMNADTTTKISLQLDLMAKNLLVEEFPRAKDFITAHKDDENIWYFTADICRMEGIGRFYIGLANHITILDGEPLKQYAAEYAKNYLIS